MMNMPTRSREEWTRDGSPVDVVDIDALLDIAVERRVRVRDPEVAEWLPDSMILAAERGLRSYTALGSRSSSAKWRELGLAV